MISETLAAWRARITKPAGPLGKASRAVQRKINTIIPEKVHAAITAAMLLAEQVAIREVIAFPLNQQGQDLLMNAPAEALDKQYKELHIRSAPPIKV